MKVGDSVRARVSVSDEVTSASAGEVGQVVDVLADEWLIVAFAGGALQVDASEVEAVQRVTSDSAGAPFARLAQA